MTLTALLFTLFPLAMIFAALFDMFTMTIPNRLVLALAGAFVVIAPFSGLGWAALGLHLSAGAAALLIGILLFSRGWIGGGDAKLFAATALWLGHGMLFDYALVASVLGGVLTLAILAARTMPLPVMLASQGWVARLHDTRTGIPYGIALAAAGLLVFPESPIFRAAM